MDVSGVAATCLLIVDVPRSGTVNKRVRVPAQHVRLNKRSSDDAGNSVCAFVHGFEPYFYIEAPTHCGPDECDCIRNVLNVRGSQHPTLKIRPGEGLMILAYRLRCLYLYLLFLMAVYHHVLKP